MPSLLLRDGYPLTILTAVDHALPALVNDVLVANNAPAANGALFAGDAIIAHHPIQPYERIIVASMQLAELAPTQSVVACVFQHSQNGMSSNRRRNPEARDENQVSINAVETALQNFAPSEELVLRAGSFERLQPRRSRTPSTH